MKPWTLGLCKSAMNVHAFIGVMLVGVAVVAILVLAPASPANSSALLEIKHQEPVNIVGSERFGRQLKQAAPSEATTRSVLVTGAAGFIGFHTAIALSRSGSFRNVVGLDNFNNYYDVQLKKDRAYHLKEQYGLEVFNEDLCDGARLEAMIATFKITDVINLAAQAGVRHSVVDPTAFARDNIECFSVLLTVLRRHPGIRLTFASSSSVYSDSDNPQGHYAPTLPLSESRHMYGASKRANEMLAKYYHNQYHIPMIGLRFFTVYGPWGRPDMALYSFAKDITAGKPIKLFDAPGLERDFTYIDDIVDGILAAVQATHIKFAILNLARGQPMSVRTMVNVLQKELNMRANMDLQPLPSTELLKTWGDITETTALLGFRPKVTLEDGVKRFVEWYQSYHREDKKKTKDQQLFEKDLTDSHHNRQQSQFRARIRARSLDLLSSRNALKLDWLDYATSRGIALPECPADKAFVFIPYLDCSIGSYSILGGVDVLDLVEACNHTPQCIAFNSNGYLKNQLSPRDTWSKWTDDPTKGIYVVANLDMCTCGLHNCDQNAHCMAGDLAMFTCTCHAGYFGDGQICIPIYDARNRYDAGPFDARQAELDQAGSINFVFHVHMDSPLGDYMKVDVDHLLSMEAKVEHLKAVCLKLSGCLGFNTNGILKSSITPQALWYAWTEDSMHGMYILDVNYCNLNDDGCFAGAACARIQPGIYDCQCTDPNAVIVEPSPQAGGPDALSKHPKSKRRCEISAKTKIARPKATDRHIHIVICADQAHYSGVPTVINSIFTTSKTPDRIVIHVVKIRDEAISGVSLENYLQCHGLRAGTDSIKIYDFDPSLLKEAIVVHSNPNSVGNLASPANFARFYLHELLPQTISKIIYLDVDMVVKADIATLWDSVDFETEQQSTAIYAAAPRPSPTYADFFGRDARKHFEAKYGFSLPTHSETFNAGLYVLNLQLWRDSKLLEDVYYWMNANSKAKLWQFGTQPIMLVIAASRSWLRIDPRWNVAGLGYRTDLTEETLNDSFLLHWNGARKPWHEDALHRDHWLRYRPMECSKRGTCSPSGCQCAHGYVGPLCEGSD